MSKDEVIAMSPLGSTQPTEISKKFSKHRRSLPPILKKALKYLYPIKYSEEKPPVSKYDSMVRKLSNFSLQKNYENNSLFNNSLVYKPQDKKLVRQLNYSEEKIDEIQSFEKSKKKQQKIRKKPKKVPLPSVSEHRRYSSWDFINCINYTGQAESEYLKTVEGQKEYKNYYDLLLLDSGLYQEIRIRHQGNQKIHYKRMPA